MTTSNKLTAAQEERLTLLIEECSEVIKCATKVLRFGYDSINPYAPQDGTNLNQLQLELGDLFAIKRLMANNEDIDVKAIAGRAVSKYNKLHTYLRQQHNFEGSDK
jgi:NTP pyrophosphatase (non-canonical NTP hydrolase)